MWNVRRGTIGRHSDRRTSIGRESIRRIWTKKGKRKGEVVKVEIRTVKMEEC
jgi:hypothetical protein